MKLKSISAALLLLAALLQVACSPEEIDTKVTSISLSQKEMTLEVGTSSVLNATVYPSDANNRAVAWAISNAGVASVDQAGKVTAIAVGTCTVTCSATDGSGVYAECKVTVSNSGQVNPDDPIASDLAKKVNATASLNETTQMWTVNIQSSLSMPGKTIKYGVTHNMTTSYTSSVHNKLNKVEWMYRYTGDDWKTNPDVSSLYSSGRQVTLYGAVVFNKSVYATGSGSSYTASIENPYYNATYGTDQNGEWQYLVENWWNQWQPENTDEAMELEVFMEAFQNIINGTATQADINIYERNGGDNAFSRETAYARYAKCYLQVFVEIDGIRYVVKEQEGKLRVPSAKDHPMDCNYPSNKKNSDEEKPKFDPDAQA